MLRAVLAVIAGYFVMAVVVALATVAAYAANDPRPTIRLPNLPSLEAMQNQRQPRFAALAFPIIGAIGVLIGGSRKRA